MNERLKKEFRDYLLSDEYANTRGSGIELIAQHFYNLALEDVRKYLESRYRINIMSIHTVFRSGKYEAFRETKEFIDNLTK